MSLIVQVGTHVKNYIYINFKFFFFIKIVKKQWQVIKKCLEVKILKKWKRNKKKENDFMLSQFARPDIKSMFESIVINAVKNWEHSIIWW